EEVQGTLDFKVNGVQKGGTFANPTWWQYGTSGTVSTNEAPILNAGADQTAWEGAAVTLGASATDKEGATITYSWTHVSGPAVTLSSTSSKSPTFTAPTYGSDADIVLQCSASDGTSATVDTVTIHLQHDDAPIASAGPDQTVNENDVVTLTAAGS